MKKIDLNDLPKYSQWVHRLLGIDSWTIPDRTIEKVETEYDRDKYKKCLEYFLQSGQTKTIEEIKQYEFEVAPESEICIACQDELYLTSLSRARSRYYDLLLEVVQAHSRNCKTIVELGCGYGYNLNAIAQKLSSVLWGGEYAENAVKLAEKLASDRFYKVVYFNFYDFQTYDFFQYLEPPILIFTSHAIEQIPSCTSFLDSLQNYREKIASVIHLEPTFELYNCKTVLGLMRHRYTELNDYNRDLISQLQQRSNIQVCQVQENVFGLNPLNPTSIVHWQYI
jgi:SAM-dependent methyltransferase